MMVVVAEFIFLTVTYATVFFYFVASQGYLFF